MKNKSKNDEQKEKSPEEIEFERLSLFLDKYISNGNLIFKYASIAGITRLRYIKGKDLKKFFTENFNDIKQEILSITNQDIGKEPDLNSLQKFYEINQKHGIFHYLKRLPGDKAKYPKRLLPLRKNEDMNLELNFSESGFYSLNIKTEKSKKSIVYLFLLILLILMFVLFPVWPLKMKLGILYFLIALMIFFIGLLVFSLLAAFVGMIIGYNIIIMANIDNYKLSWKDRIFKSFILIEKREDPCWFKIIRIVMVISFTQMGIIAYLYPSIPKEVFSSMKSIIISGYRYIVKKVEDFHYRRNDIKVRTEKYMNDL